MNLNHVILFIFFCHHGFGYSFFFSISCPQLVHLGSNRHLSNSYFFAYKKNPIQFLLHYHDLSRCIRWLIFTFLDSILKYSLILSCLYSLSLLFLNCIICLIKTLLTQNGFRIRRLWISNNSTFLDICVRYEKLFPHRLLRPRVFVKHC